MQWNAVLFLFAASHPIVLICINLDKVEIMDFKKAISVAFDTAKDLLPKAKEFNLEEAIISKRLL